MILYLEGSHLLRLRVISDGENGRLAQMNGGYVNDAGSQLVLAHPPSISQQPAADISVAPGQRAESLGKTSTWTMMRGFGWC